MNRIDSRVLALQMLRQGKGIRDVVDATALEPSEVKAMAAKVADQVAREVPTASVMLVDLADRVNSQAVLAKYPRKAQTLLARAADLIMRAQDQVEADAGKAALRAKRDKLKEELARVNAELRGQTTTGAAPPVNMSEVRQWAISSGYEVPKAGRLKQHIIDAYLQEVAA